MMEPLPETKKKGRPKVHDQARDRVRAFRGRKQAEGKRLDIFVNTKAICSITAFSKAWGCSISSVVERLIMLANEEYKLDLLPETEILSIADDPQDVQSEKQGARNMKEKPFSNALDIAWNAVSQLTRIKEDDHQRVAALMEVRDYINGELSQGAT